MGWELDNLPIIIEPNARSNTKDKMQPDEYYALIQKRKLVFIDFYAPWCTPCQKMMPIIDSLKTVYQNNIFIVKINVDASKKLAKELKLISVPYLVLYQNNKIIYSQKGSLNIDELIKVFEKNI